MLSDGGWTPEEEYCECGQKLDLSEFNELETPMEVVSTSDRIKNKTLDLWHDLHESDMSLDEFEKLREFIINLFLEDN